MNDFVREMKIPILLSILIIVLGSIAYFALGIGASMEPNTSIYDGMKIKAAYADGSLKIFALANDESLSKYKVEKGSSIPQNNTIVIGFDEANMMIEENLFSNTGDEIKGLFGVDVKVGGILTETGTLIDDFHFVSGSDYDLLKGEENKIFIRLNDEGMPKAFYTYRKSDDQIKVKLAEGDIKDYVTNNIAEEKYYPLLIGSKEAKMMREENLFSKPGDIIKDFFGKNVVVVGVLEQTGTGLDMMHFIPLAVNEL